jgi:MEMO1 family protein
LHKEEKYMGRIVNSYIMPHPPIVVPGVGKGREAEARDTIEGMKKAARDIAQDNPTTIIISSPHAPSFRDYVYISDAEELHGDFSAFGDGSTSMSFGNNLELVGLIADKARLAGINAGGLSKSTKQQYGIPEAIDHGALVPLYFISQVFTGFKVVHISTPFMPFTDLYELGKCIAEAVGELKENVVYVASGDLSHRLTKDAPAGYSEAGKEYDDFLVNKILSGDVEGILNLDTGLMEAAGECGTRSIIMMLGAMDGKKLMNQVYSYEGPYGVGYLVAKIDPPDEGESIHVKLARESLETYVRENRKIDIPEWAEEEMLKSKGGVFVSLKIRGHLRGCIGTIAPTKESIAEEIINNAISSGTMDPRFETVVEEELHMIKYSVDVLGKPERIMTLEELDVKRYGVIVTSGYKRGLLLPDLEGVDNPAEQVNIALRKAGIRDTEEFELERFEVIRYK